MENVLTCYGQTKNTLFQASQKESDASLHHELKAIHAMEDICENLKILKLKKKLHEYRLERLTTLFEKIDSSHHHSYFELLLIQSGLLKLPLNMKAFAEKCIERTVTMIEATPTHTPF